MASPSSTSITVIDSQTTVDTQSGGYRPSGWNQPATYTITVPVSSQPIATSNAAPQPNNPIVYVFDAILRADHNRSVHKTEHPVQTMANITDHAYLNPAKLVLEVGMSDAMDSFTAGQWSGASTKSVNAYQTLVTLMTNRQLLTLGTKLDSYTNMIIVDINAVESKDTVHSVRARVQFEQMITATVNVTSAPGSDSARPQTTAATNTGNVQTTPVSSSTMNSFQVPAASQVMVPGAGNWSSNSSAVRQNLPTTSLPPSSE